MILHLLALSFFSSQAAESDCTMCANDPKRMEQAEIVGHGPFTFFATDSQEVAKRIKNKNLMWVETKHFRFGAELKPWKIPVKDKKSYLAELTEFAKAFPHLKPKKIKTLDPWMRIHLMAWRSENAYQQLLDMFGWADDPFVLLPDESIFVDAAENGWEEILKEHWLKAEKRIEELPQWLGLGQHFGMPMKHEVLLLIKEKHISTIKRDYIGLLDSHPQRWHNDWHPFGENPVSRSMWFGLSTASEKIKSDRHLHNAVLHNVIINLFDGYMLYLYEAPVWMRVGLGHYFTQINDPRYNMYDLDEGSSGFNEDSKNWIKSVKSIVAKDKTQGFAKLGAMRSFGDIDFNAHVESWSKIVFMYQLDPPKFAKWILLLKNNSDATANLDAQRKALKEAYGWSFMKADEEWTAWVNSLEVPKQ
ncbi:MAG: hypothetical protein H8E25_06325 [Planctomycetes bacterium]|nr:hypothetical protein [Planctomycetota bacterium]